MNEVHSLPLQSSGLADVSLSLNGLVTWVGRNRMCPELTHTPNSTERVFMNHSHSHSPQNTVQAATMSNGQRFMEWAQEPLGSLIVASVGTMSTLGVVLSSIWAINVVLN